MTGNALGAVETNESEEIWDVLELDHAARLVVQQRRITDDL